MEARRKGRSIRRVGDDAAVAHPPDRIFGVGKRKEREKRIKKDGPKKRKERK